jgi:anthranilate phosphoribosyltransferase
MKEIVKRVSAGENLTVEEMSSVVDTIMQGQCGEEEIADLLLGLRAKGETVEEIAGAAQAMRKHMTPIRTSHQTVIDTCGTGGDASSTFNISTAAALVTAAAGVPVAKHGNRSITSKSGSADVLAALGVNIEAGVQTIERCLDEIGICFCFAPLLHPSMKHVAPVRRKLGVPTVFNMLGPLCNPASAPFQLLGVGRPPLRPMLSAALRLLDVQRAVVVCGEDGLDEVTLNGRTFVSDVTPDGIQQYSWTPDQFGLTSGDTASLRVDGPEASAAMIRGVLKGERGAQRDIVVLNAAAALWTARKSSSLEECSEMAAEALDSGKANSVLDDLCNASHA